MLLRPAGCGRGLVPNEWLIAASTADQAKDDWAQHNGGLEFIAPKQLAALGPLQAAALGCRQFGLADLQRCLSALPPAGLASKTPSWFDRLGCYLHMEVVGAEACGLLAGLRIWPLKHQTEGGTGGLGCLADGPIFSELPEAWAGVLRSGAIRVLREPPHSVPYQSLAAAAGIRPATRATIAGCIRDQHLAGRFPDVAAVWAGLRFLKDHLFTAGHDAAGFEDVAGELAAELRLALCAPSYAGPLMLLREMTVPSLLGLHCTACFDTFDNALLATGTGAPAEPLAPPRFEPADKDTLEARPRIEAGAIVTAFEPSAAAERDWATAVASAGATRGRVCFEIRVGPPASGSTASTAVGLCTAAAAKAAAGQPASPREGAVVLFGDGTVWLGTAVAAGAQAFGPGDTLTVAADADCNLLHLAVNGVIVPGLGDLSHRVPTAPTAGASDVGELAAAALPLPRCMAGGELRPLVLARRTGSGQAGRGGAGAVAEARLGSGAEVAALSAAGYGWLAARLAAGVRARRQELALSVDLRLAPDCAVGVPGTEQAAPGCLGWEAFCLVVGGSAPHDQTCAHRHIWNGQTHGDCAVCLSPFVHPVAPPVAIAGCEHLFHAGCIHRWAARKPTCPVCRGPADRSTFRPVAADLTVTRLAAATADTLHALATEDSPGRTWTSRRLLLALLRAYAARPLPAAVLRAAAVSTTLGLRPLGDTFAAAAYRRLGGSCLPYLSLPSMPADLVTVLGQLGVAAKLSQPGLLRAIARVAAAVQAGDGPAEAGLLELFAGLYSALAAGDRDGAAAVGSAFTASPLIFAGSPRLRLLPLRGAPGAEGSCCWDGPEQLASLLDMPRLRPLYPALRRFFVEVVGARKLGLADCALCLRRLGRGPQPGELLDRVQRVTEQVCSVYAAAEELLPTENVDAPAVAAELYRLPLVCTASHLESAMECWIPCCGTELVLAPEPATDELLALLSGATNWHSVSASGGLEHTDDLSKPRVSGLGRYALLDLALFKAAPRLLDALRPGLYRLTEVARIRRLPGTGGERVEEPVWDGWCKDYLRLRFGVDDEMEDGLWDECPHPLDDLGCGAVSEPATSGRIRALRRRDELQISTPDLDASRAAQRAAAASLVAALRVERVKQDWGLRAEVELFPQPSVAGRGPKHAELQPDANACCTVALPFEYGLPEPAAGAGAAAAEGPDSRTDLARRWLRADPHHVLGAGCGLAVVAGGGGVELEPASVSSGHRPSFPLPSQRVPTARASCCLSSGCCPAQARCCGRSSLPLGSGWPGCPGALHTAAAQHRPASLCRAS